MTKTMTFAAVHFSVAFSVAYILTGSIAIGGAIALVEPAVNTIAYYFHEKVWSKYQYSGKSVKTFFQQAIKPCHCPEVSPNFTSAKA